jgi:hypothetical protein
MAHLPVRRASEAIGVHPFGVRQLPPDVHMRQRDLVTTPASAYNRHLRDLLARRFPGIHTSLVAEPIVGVKKTGKGRRKLGRKKRRMRSRIRHRKG